MAGTPCATWDVSPGEFGVCPGWDAYSTQVKATAIGLAVSWLWATTGRRFGPCPITVRPNQARRGEPVLYQTFPVTPGTQGMNQPGGPFLFGGRWFNDGCGAACCGDDACAIVLRGTVYAVNEVTVDDEVIPPSAYRVDVTNGVHLLVRIDGECWPTCQSVSAEPGEIGSFVVEYEVGETVPPALLLAAGALACQYGKYLTGGACALPAQMTRLSRQGVEIEVEPPAPGEGKTGIKLVDDVVTLFNPSGLRQPPRVMSPDVPGTCDRYTTVPAGS